jgi:hypothetical protein
MNSNKLNIQYVTADWKDIEGLSNSFKKAIEKVFKGKVYLAPSFNGTDSFGFIVSDKPLTRQQIKEIDYVPDIDEGA